MKVELNDVYKNSGFASRKMGFGKRPAIAAIDFSYSFTDPSDGIFSGGRDYSPEVDACAKILEAARAKKVPVVFTTVAYSEPEEVGLWLLKNDLFRLCMVGSQQVDIDARLNRQPDEALLVKQYASGFFGTHLASYLTARNVDTLIITGVTTCGCVRATAVDTLQHGFRPIVVRDAVGDRAQGPHEASLFDIESKYGDVEDSETVIKYLNNLSLDR